MRGTSNEVNVATLTIKSNVNYIRSVKFNYTRRIMDTRVRVFLNPPIRVTFRGKSNRPTVRRN